MYAIPVRPGSGPIIPSETSETTRLAPWSAVQLVLFRFAFVFVLQLTLPLRYTWFQRLSEVRSLRQFFALSLQLGADYVTIEGESGRWGLASFATVGIAALIAIVAAAVWTWFARNSPRREYHALNYWLRLFVRYWVSLNILHYAYIKFLPMQMPFPSIANIHTLFGEHAPYRLYWQAVGIVTWYEVFLGVAEVVAGSLLLFRATTALGAVCSVVIMYNVTHGNFAYDGGVHVLSAKITLLSAFLLVPYLPDLWRLLIKREDVRPFHYRPSFGRAWQRRAFAAAKVVAWVLFIPGFMYDTYYGFYHTNFSKEPRSPAIAGVAGYYNVTEFRLNGETLPYSPLDPVRWHDVVFEDYPTLVYKTNRALPVRLENGSPGYYDADKIYELAGFAGGKTYLHYDIDDATGTLTLRDKSLRQQRTNAGAGRGGAARPDAGAARFRPVELTWHASPTTGARIVLTGVDAERNAIEAVLDPIDEHLAIHIDEPVEGRPPRYERLFTRRYPVTGRSFDGTGARQGPGSGGDAQ